MLSELTPEVIIDYGTVYAPIDAPLHAGARAKFADGIEVTLNDLTCEELRLSEGAKGLVRGSASHKHWQGNLLTDDKEVITVKDRTDR